MIKNLNKFIIDFFDIKIYKDFTDSYSKLKYYWYIIKNESSHCKTHTAITYTTDILGSIPGIKSNS